MLLIILWPLLIAAVGFLLLTFAAHPQLKHLGDVMLWCGVLWSTYATLGEAFRIGQHIAVN